MDARVPKNDGSLIAQRLLSLFLALTLVAGGAVSSLHRTLHAGIVAHAQTHSHTHRHTLNHGHTSASEPGFFAALSAQIDTHDEGDELCRLLDAANADSVASSSPFFRTDAPETRVQLASSGIVSPVRAWLLPPARAPPTVA